LRPGGAFFFEAALDFIAARRDVEVDARCEEDLLESASLIVSLSLLFIVALSLKCRENS